MKDLHEDNLFGPVRERLGRYEEAPSEAVWEKITSQRKQSDPILPVWLEGFTVGVMAAVAVMILSLDNRVDNHPLADKKVEVTSSKSEDEQLKAQAPLQTSDFQQRPIQKITTAGNHGTRINNSLTQPLYSDITYQPEAPLKTSNVEPQPDADSISVDEQVRPDIEMQSPKKEVVPPYKKPKSKFQLYISVIPSLSFQKMIPAQNDQVVVQGFSHTSSLSMKRFGFGMDAGFQKEINNILGYYGGLSFYRQHQELTYTYFNREGDVTRVGDEWTFEINRPQYARTFDYSMTNIGARAGILVTLKGEKLKHKFGAGLMYSYNLKSSSYLAYQLSYRNEIRINDRWSWYVEPMFTYSFLSKEKLEEPFELKPYRAGISAGVLYRF